jgi:NADH dehydrogenase
MRKKVLILGGAGFVGTHLCNRLTEKGYAIRVPTQKRERNKHLLVYPTLELIQADIHDPGVLNKLCADCDVLINLVGILNEHGLNTFERAHVELAQKIVAASKKNGIKRLLQMSALNADAVNGASRYLQTKGRAEDLVHQAADENFRVTSFRPSVIFGPDDGFFNRFAALLKIVPGIFPLACPDAKFAPVYVGDVAEAMARSINDPKTYGQRFDLCGPDKGTLEACVRYTAELLGLRRKILRLGPLISRLQAQILERLPGQAFTMDNYRSLQVDSICTGQNGLVTLGITPAPIDAIVPGYLATKSMRGNYDRWRSHARRDED